MKRSRKDKRLLIERWAITSVAILTSIVCMSAGSALAINITIGASPPNSDVILQQLSAEDASPMDFRTAAGHRFWGQTFTAASDLTLEKMSFLIQQGTPASRATEGMTMQVDVFSANSVSDTSGITLFGGAQTGLTPDFTRGAQQWITFDVDNVALTQGQIYGFTIDFAFVAATIASPPGPNPNNGHLIGNDFGVFRNNGDILAGGQLFEFSGGVFNSQADRDLTFVLQGQGPPPPPVLTPNTIRMETFGSAGLPNEFVEINNTHDNGNDFGFSNTNNAGGSAGEAGGTFARSVELNSYSDVDLTDGLGGVFDRTKTLVLSGKGVFTDATTADGNIFLGYTGDGGQLIGLLASEPSGGGYRVQAAIKGVNPVQQDVSAIVEIDLDEPFEFDLTYTGTPNGDGTLEGFINGTFVSITGALPDLSTNTFNKFGVGSGYAVSSNATQTAGAFFDDLTYSIFVVPEPSSFGLAIAGLVGIVAAARRKRQAYVRR